MTITHAIFDALRAFGRPLSTDEIIWFLEDDYKPSSVRTTLSGLMWDRRIKRERIGVGRRSKFYYSYIGGK